MKKINQLFSLFTLMTFGLITTNLNAQVGIGTTTPAGGSILDVTSIDKGLLVPRVSIANLTTIAPVTGGATDGLLVWNTNAGTGVGYHYWDGADWIPLGGGGWSLTGNAGTNPATNFIGTTDGQDLSIRRNSTEMIRVNNSVTSFMNEIQTRDGAANSGDILARIYDSNDDGVIDVYENNAMNHRIHGNGQTIFNNQEIDVDFRIASTGDSNMFYVNSANDQIFMRRSTHHIPAYIDPFNVYAQSIGGGGGTGIQYAVAGWNQGTAGGGGNFVIEDITNPYAAMEASTVGTGIAVRGLDTSAGGSIAVAGSTTSLNGIGVYGSSPTSGSGGTGFGVLSFGDFGYTAAIYNLSDARAKKDIVGITSALDKIMRINGFTYKYNLKKYNSNLPDDDRVYYGFLAQNIQEVMPEAVAKKTMLFANTDQQARASKDEMGTEATLNAVNYQALIPVLVEAMKEQQLQIEALKARIQQLEKE